MTSVSRQADLHYAFQFGQDFARTGNPDVADEFAVKFSGDPEALGEFNRGVADEKVRREKGFPAEQRPDWRTPTTYLARFRAALLRMCGALPPEDLCHEWLSGVQVDGVDRLQEWVLAQPGTPVWAQGLITLEAAQVWADTPTEGVPHEYRE